MNKDPQAIVNALRSAYKILKFTDKEADGALGDLGQLEQLATFAELSQVLSKEEIAELSSGYPDMSPEQKQQAIQVIFQKHLAEPELAAKVEAAQKKVLDEHLAMLTKLGDDNQKKEVEQALVGVLV